MNLEEVEFYRRTADDVIQILGLSVDIQSLHRQNRLRRLQKGLQGLSAHRYIHPPRNRLKRLPGAFSNN